MDLSLSYTESRTGTSEIAVLSVCNAYLGFHFLLLLLLAAIIMIGSLISTTVIKMYEELLTMQCSSAGSTILLRGNSGKIGRKHYKNATHI